MAGETQDTNWPPTTFYFMVWFGDNNPGLFQEVSGLESQTELNEYRHGDTKRFQPIKMPGLSGVGHVTLRKGIFTSDSTFWTWYNEIKLNTIKRRTVVIQLMGETGAPKMKWTLNNAWPTKITGPDLKSEGNEVAVESVEVAFETMTVSATERS